MPTRSTRSSYGQPSSSSPFSSSSSSAEYHHIPDSTDGGGAEMSTRTEMKMTSTASKTINKKTNSGSERKIMSEDEVSTLVQNALMRARQATSSFSPRSSPSRHSTHKATSPSSQTGSTTTMRPPAPQDASSPRSSIRSSNSNSSPYVPNDEDMNNSGSLPSLATRRSKRSHSYRINTSAAGTTRTRYASGARSRAIEGGRSSGSGGNGGYDSPMQTPQTPQTPHSLGSSIDDYATPDTSEAGVADFVDLANSSSMVSTEADGEHRYVTTVNSSDAIIRKVEEEIANARKAAQEANRRLAGVSANLTIRNTVSSSSSFTRTVPSKEEDDGSGTGAAVAATPPTQTSPRPGIISVVDDVFASRQAAEATNSAEEPPAAAESMLLQQHLKGGQTTTSSGHSLSDGASSEFDEQHIFDSAMNVIGQEFDLMDDTLGRNNLTSNRVQGIDISASDGLPSSLNPTSQPTEGSVLGTLLNPLDVSAASPNGILRETNVEERKMVHVSLATKDISHDRPTIDCTNIPDDEEVDVVMSPSEEIDSILKAASGEEGGDEPSSPKEVVLKSLIGTTDVPHDVPHDELAKDAIKVPTTSESDEEENEGADTWVPISDDSPKVAQVSSDRDRESDEKMLYEDGGDEPFDERTVPTTHEEPVDDPALDHAEKEATADSKTFEESKAEKNEMNEDSALDDDVENEEDAKTEMKKEKVANTEGVDDENEDNEILKSDSQVFIYQVVSAGSTDAVATGRVPLPKDSSDEMSSPGKSESGAVEDDNVDEAIEILTDRNESWVSNDKETIIRMNSSDTSAKKNSESEKDVRMDNMEASYEDNVAPVDNQTTSGDANSLPVESTAVLKESTVQSLEEESNTMQVEVPQVDRQADEHGSNHVAEENLLSQQVEEKSDSEHQNTPDDLAITKQPTIEASEPTETKVTITLPKLAPSPRRVALVENRRSVELRVNGARSAMCGEEEVPEKTDRGETLVNRSKKVKFKQRYPVPPPIRKPRQPSEIVMNYRAKTPTESLYQAKPKKDLSELLEAATGSSLARRSNACGALKVLSTQKKNKLTLVSTLGFLDAMVFAMQDDFSKRDAENGVAARTRAINVILNVAEVKDNRHHILNYPGMADALVKCMVEDKDEGRALACAALATIAKSAHCREGMAVTSNLIEILAVVLKGDEPSMYGRENREKATQCQPQLEEEKKGCSEDDDDASASDTSRDSNSTASSVAKRRKAVAQDTARKNEEAKKRARMNACAALLHLSKECCISQRLCSSGTLKYCLVASSKETDNPIHTKCLEIMCNLSRFPHNNSVLAEYPGLVETLVINGQHDDDTDRLWSMRTLQNLSSDTAAKNILAQAKVLELLSMNMMRQKYEEQLAATAALYNISTEPGAVVPLTNTRNVVATLVHVAHSPTSEPTIRTIACDALATLGLWLQTLAGAGTVPEDVTAVPLPSYITTGWKRWEA